MKTFNLKNEKCYPFRKPNNDPLYINALLNHPRNIIKEIPNVICKRISEISCDEHKFEKAKGDYNKALEKSGVSVKKLNNLKNDVLNVCEQEKLYGLTLHTVAM